ncbi:MAG: NEW3 domain-containing protein [Armatimonadetes bacterium]|nr:NEW3 domain-containing protein [Armatimonadota bacterium]
MRHANYIRHTVAALLICIILECSASANIVTLDVAAKSAVSDTGKLTSTKVNVSGEQVGVTIKSTILTPQKFTLKLTGVKDEEYDLYINKSYVGKKSFSELAGGIELSIPGRIVDESQMRCVKAAEPRIQAEMKRLGQAQEGEPQRVSYTLGQAYDWTHLMIGKEEGYRSVDIIIAPAGRMLRQMPSRERLDEEHLLKAMDNSCSLLQQARDRMYRVINDTVLRNDAVVAMTPVDLSAAYSKANGKQRIIVTLTNNCDLPVRGVIGLKLPKGWKADTKTLKAISLTSGKTFRKGIDLVPPTAGSIPAEPVKAVADLTVERGAFLAKFTLSASATGPSVR